MSRGKIESDRLKVKAKREWTFILIILFGFILFGIYDSHKSNKEKEKAQIQANIKWDKWEAYRKENCQLKEKIYGVSMQQGKSHYNTNFNSYECKNGFKHTIEESKDQRGTNEIYIPEVPKI